ncbi:MAG: hypothetical protein KZQ98_17820 [Candidatus Thiodiazotropha sp. (ex Lucinoma borealis)]|nr:hypothetical protein [Candidatus Thiodiazotropha sp. (ex Lucinoma borealis)]
MKCTKNKTTPTDLKETLLLGMQLHDRALAGLEAVSIILNYIDALEEDPETQAIDYFDSPEMRRDLLYAVWVLSRYARKNREGQS